MEKFSVWCDVFFFSSLFGKKNVFLRHSIFVIKRFTNVYCHIFESTSSSSSLLLLLLLLDATHVENYFAVWMFGISHYNTKKLMLILNWLVQQFYKQIFRSLAALTANTVADSMKLMLSEL